MHTISGFKRARGASLREASLVLVGALAVASCGVQPTHSTSSDAAGAAEQPTAALGAQAEPAGPPAPAAPQKIAAPKTDPEPLPELAFSVNGGQSAIAYQGRPLILEVALFHPHDAETDAPRGPLLLAAGAGAEPAIVHLEIKNERGETQTWPLHRYGEAAMTLTLEVDEPVELAWWLSPEETATLAPGAYELSAVLDTTAAVKEGAWKGRATSGSVTVRVQPEPPALSAAQKSDKFQLLASYELLRGDAKRALTRIDELLRELPDDFGALEYRGDLLALDGNAQAALDAYQRAGRVYRKAFRQPPPDSLLRKQREQLNKLIAQPPPAAKGNDGPLEVGFLSADVAAGKFLESPFPVSAERLSFVWKLSDAAKAGALEARWIADAGGREIARNQAKPGAGSGEFLCKKPEEGFAPGDYRLELWQADKRLHTEPFTLAAAPAPPLPVQPAATGKPPPTTAGAPAPERTVEGWGKFVDPAGDCRIAAENGGVTITVPGTEHNLNPLAEYDNVLAPRLLETVEGDFQLEVRVAPFTRPKAGTSTTKQGHSYVAAGILIRQDDKTFIRWLRAALGERDDLFAHAEAFQDAKRAEPRFLLKDRLIPDEATHLRVERRYGRFKLSWSVDGKSWKALAQLPDDGFAKRLEVGVAAVNTVNTEGTFRFDGRQLVTPK